jgi:hypothetical protein
MARLPQLNILLLLTTIVPRPVRPSGRARWSHLPATAHGATTSPVHQRDTRHAVAVPHAEVFTFRIFERIFERMGENYFVSWNLSDRLFISPGFEGIIPGYPTNPLYSSVFLARLKSLHHNRVFFRKII